jgi:hypothetical protein
MKKILRSSFDVGEVDEGCATGGGTELSITEVRRVLDSEKAKNAVDGKHKMGPSVLDKFDVCHGHRRRL